jgi:translocation and assembly module TamA
VVEIAGLTVGAVFSSRDLERAAERLRRSGVFSTVVLEEGEAITAPDLLGITARVTEAKPRRLSLGVEASTLDGLRVSADWLHRNLFGGGERFLIGVEATNIGATGSGVDYGLAIGLERPATPFADTTAGVTLALDHLDEVDYLADSAALGLSFRHVFSPELSASLGLGYDEIQGEDALGDFRYQSLNLPLGLTWDRRDSKLDPTRLYLVDLGVRPFLGFGETGDGARVTFDLRGYRALDPDRRLVLAARVQGGTILGAGALDAPRDDLFYSGGGGTVRGQPYQSLGVTMTTPDGPVGTGGTSFAAASFEARLKVAQGWGGAAFVDVGTVGDQGLSGLGEAVHAGAGIGLRYDTGFGPLRFDLALPVAGDTGLGPQIYVGLGQAF